jgi:MFS family permease
MFAVLRQRNFGLLWFGGIVSVIGDWVLFIALPFFIYQETGSALATGGMFIAEVLPRIALGSGAGVFVDRWDRRRTMIVADVTRAALLLLLILPRSAEWLVVVYVVAFAESAISQFFNPAKSALIPRLVSEDDLMAANSLNSLSDNLPRLVGPSLGGALMGLLGLSSVVLVDSLSYVISAITILLIVVPAAAPAPEVEQRSATDAATGVVREWLSGLQVVRRDSLISTLFVVLGIAMIAEGILNVLLVPFVQDVLKVGALQFGWLMTARGIGGLLGGIVVGQLGRRVAPTRLIALGGGAAGLIFLASVNSRSFPIVMGLVVLIGIPAIATFVTAQTLLQQGVDDRFRGRVFGAFGTTNALLMLAGMGLAGGAGNALGIVPLLDVASGLYLLAGLVGLVFLREPAPSALPVRSPATAGY